MLTHLDAIIFAGGIGENSDYIHTQVLNKTARLGFGLNQQKNKMARFGQSACITTSAMKTLVIPTNKEFIIAEDAYGLTKKD